MIVIPDECVKYIRWQRARYVVARCPDPEDVKRLYTEWVIRDFEMMVPFLPEKVESILEIGCGLATVEVLMKQRYPDAKLYLLDGDGANLRDVGTDNETGPGGFQQELKPYNSRKHTELLLSANGVKVDKWYDVGTKEHLKADLIFSLYSWGCHYPIKTYDVEGFVIADLKRKCEEPRGKLVWAGPKYDRCAWAQH